MKKNGFGTGLMYVLLIFLAVGLGFLVFFNFRANQRQQQTIEQVLAEAAATPTPEPTATPAPTAEPDRTTETITLAFAGDLVGQAGLATDAQTTAEDGSAAYDFTEELYGVRGSIESADLAACTLVSTLTSTGDYDSYRLPASLATGLQEAGFDLVNAASDHIMDRGLEGLVETVNALNGAQLGVVGAYTSSSRSFPMASVNGVKVAFLSYTYGTAGTGATPVSIADNNWCLDLLTTDYMTDKTTVDYEKIDTDIATVREAGADIVVCFVYWWDNTQYYTDPRDSQKEVADHLLESGVDILIGGGVKVPQPIETRVVERDGGSANCVVCYSLSNLMSCFNDANTNVSAVATVQLSRDKDTGDVWVSGVSTRPLFMVDTDDYEGYSEPGYKYRLVDARNEAASFEQGGGILNQASYQAVQESVESLNALLGEEYDGQTGGVTLDYPY